MIRDEFIAKDGKKISYVIWNDVENPKAVLQIAHGMVEHVMRYDGFAKEMNRRGFVVAADDHRAHGKTDEKNLGYSEGDIWENTLSDMSILSDLLIEKYHLPIILLGHSYGSFLSQAYIRRYDRLSGAIIGGSNYLAGASVSIGKAVAGMGKLFKGEKKPALLIKKLTFDAYNKKFPNGTFISSIPEECERYERDELCNFVCSNNFYYSFFKGAKKLYKGGGVSLNRFHILLIAGDSDPVGNMGKGVKKLEKWYRARGTKVSCKLYDGVRHEFLNDTSREDAINEIEKFCLSVI